MSVCNHTRDQQIGLPRHSYDYRPTSDSTQSSYQHYKVLLTTRIYVFSVLLQNGGNLYGVHALYTCLENENKAHGVFLLNSNAMGEWPPRPDFLARPKAPAAISSSVRVVWVIFVTHVLSKSSIVFSAHKQFYSQWGATSSPGPSAWAHAEGPGDEVEWGATLVLRTKLNPIIETALITL